MGKGDRRSRRGKLFRGTHGRTLPSKKKENKPVTVAVTKAPQPAEVKSSKSPRKKKQ
jgi:ribosomal small subunit protein bTHX